MALHKWGLELVAVVVAVDVTAGGLRRIRGEGEVGE